MIYIRSLAFDRFDAFTAFQQGIESCLEGTEKQGQECRPTLLGRYEKDCAPPARIAYEPGQPLESVCFPASAEH